MFVLRRLPALLTLLMLGAHFLRFGQLPLVALCLALLVPLFVPRPWAQAVTPGPLVGCIYDWVVLQRALTNRELARL